MSKFCGCGRIMGNDNGAVLHNLSVKQHKLHQGTHPMGDGSCRAIAFQEGRYGVGFRSFHRIDIFHKYVYLLNPTCKATGDRTFFFFGNTLNSS